MKPALCDCRIFSRRLFIAALIAVVLAGSLWLTTAGEAGATTYPPYVIYDSLDNMGGNCTMIGTWDDATNTCTLTTDITITGASGSVPAAIEVSGDGITIDGAGHTISGSGQTGAGVQIYNFSTPVVKNLKFNDLYYGIDMLGSTGGQIIYNDFSGCYIGLFLETGSNAALVGANDFRGGVKGLQAQSASNHNIYMNDFLSPGQGIYLSDSDNSVIFNNNFFGPEGSSLYVLPSSTGNSFNVSQPTGGNYWDAHARESQGCVNADNDRFCDTGYTYPFYPVTDDLPLARKRAFFSWYDSYSPGAKNWVLMANGGLYFNTDSFFDLFIGGTERALPALTGKQPGEVPALKSVTPIYPGVIGGPVEVGYHGSALISQRTLWAGNSLEEVIATDAGKLGSHYWWTWYDQQSPGYKNWVLVSNPNSVTIYYRVRIAGQVPASTNGQPAQGSLAPGQSVTPQFAGAIGGPVEAEAWTDGVGGTNQVAFYASQRVLINGDTAFNEVPGVANGDLSDHYVWSWYDQKSPGAKDWVLIANPTHNAMSYQLWVAGEGPFEGYVPPDGYAFRTLPGKQGGPVEVKTFYDGTTTPLRSVVSQRVVWGPSFEEMPGQPFTTVDNDYWWTWYDQQSAGMTNWVLVANPSPNPVVSAYQIKIGGVVMDLDPNTPGQQGDFVYQGDVKSYKFPGTIGGPVEVISDNPVIATQRVLYNGFFNEVIGSPPPLA